MKHRKYVSFKDPKAPLSARKVAYVHWLMQKKGLSLSEAKIRCDRYFGMLERQEP